MFSTTIIFPLLVLSSIVSISFGQNDSPCPFLGPDFLAPASPSNSNAIKSAIQSVNSSLKTALVDATMFGQLDPNTTSFSINVYSTNEEPSLFTYHYSAPGLAHSAEGVATVNSNTIYRIGSLSKLLTVYTYLTAAGDISFNEPITKYIPELAAYAVNNAATLKDNDIDLFDWEDITVGSLANQLSGIVRDFSLGPVVEAQYEKLGLPPFPASNVSYCGPNPAVQGQLPCNRSGKSDFASSYP